MDIKEYLTFIKNKNVGFLGIGRSNMPLIKILFKEGVNITVRDKKKIEELGEIGAELIDMGVRLITGDNYHSNLSEHDIIYKTPGIRGDKEEILKAIEKGTSLESEMELFFELCPCKIFAVTGSDGKTTTTTLIYKILEESGYKCHLGGNIGRPLIGDIEKIGKNDFAIVELSSFQLMNMKKSADVAVITNISQNHLDWHKDYEEYIEAKKNIFKFQNEDGLYIVNEDNEFTKAMKNEGKGRCKGFSRLSKSDVYYENGEIYVDGEHILGAKDILLLGMHNVENYMAAIGATRDYATKESIKKVAETFGGVEHRNEFVREVEGISFYNDSIASSPTRTKATLSSFDEKVILIAGGYDKKLDYEPLGSVVHEKVKALVLMGATSEKIEKAVLNEGKCPIYKVNNLKEGIALSQKLAERGDKVVLSPASASFDMFKDFEERGKKFKEIVNSL